jgi:hypothetical protein
MRTAGNSGMGYISMDDGVIGLLAGVKCHCYRWKGEADALIKKKIKFSLHIRKFRVEQLQSHI